MFLPLLAYHFAVTFEQFSLTSSQAVFALNVDLFKDRVGLLRQFFIGATPIRVVDL